eukprot:gene31072-37553_t
MNKAVVLLLLLVVLSCNGFRPSFTHLSSTALKSSSLPEHNDANENADFAWLYSHGDSSSARENPSTSWVEEQTKVAFNKFMKNHSVPLFRDFESYAKSLPVRFEATDYVQLYRNPFFMKEEDLQHMAWQVMHEDVGVLRQQVRYVAAPPASGKTSSILPAFLSSTGMKDGGTHYLYMAFNNNGCRSFSLDSDLDRNVQNAEKQGAAFIVKCVEHLLESANYAISIPLTKLPRVNSSVESLKDVFARHFPAGSRIWVHVDEHAQMCPRSYHQPDDPGAAFSRGALKTLAKVPMVTVIATYTERPLAIPPAASSSVICRVPVALPPVDLDQLLQHVPEFRVVHEMSRDRLHMKTNDNRLLASLKHRLGLKIQQKSVASYCNRREDVAEFLRDFEASAAISDVTKRLKKLNQVCGASFQMGSHKFLDDAAACKRLLGMTDDDDGKIDGGQMISQVVTLPDRRLGVSIPRLLSIRTPDMDSVYNMGRRLYKESIQCNPNVLSSTPLEAACIWTLASTLHLLEELTLGPFAFESKCVAIKPGRIFPGGHIDDGHQIDEMDIEKEVLYYADERSGKPTHPLADIFFRARNAERDDVLVLVDVTGEDRGAVEEKAANLADWIQRAQVRKYKLQGVVLAPLVSKKPIFEDENVAVVGGEQARFLLGSLCRAGRFY